MCKVVSTVIHLLDILNGAQMALEGSVAVNHLPTVLEVSGFISSHASHSALPSAPHPSHQPVVHSSWLRCSSSNFHHLHCGAFLFSFLRGQRPPANHGGQELEFWSDFLFPNISSVGSVFHCVFFSLLQMSRYKNVVGTLVAHMTFLLNSLESWHLQSCRL